MLTSNSAAKTLATANAGNDVVVQHAAGSLGVNEESMVGHVLSCTQSGQAAGRTDSQSARTLTFLAAHSFGGDYADFVSDGTWWYVSVKCIDGRGPSFAP